MADNTSASSGGVGFCGLLTIVFVVAKLWDKIDWSWLWVFSPMWIPLAVVMAIIVVWLLVALCILIGAAITESVERRRREKAKKAFAAVAKHNPDVVEKNGWKAHSRVYAERNMRDGGFGSSDSSNKH